MLDIRPARPDDSPAIMALIRDLARYEKLLDQVDADETMIGRALFGPQPRVFCEIAQWTAPGSAPVAAGFALWLIRAGHLPGEFVTRQGTALGRNGRVRIETDDGGDIWVGGTSRTLVEGTLTL